MMALAPLADGVRAPLPGDGTAAKVGTRQQPAHSPHGRIILRGRCRRWIETDHGGEWTLIPSPHELVTIALAIRIACRSKGAIERQCHVHAFASAGISP